MIGEIANQDIQNKAKMLKVKRRQQKSLKKQKKLSEVINTVFYGLPTTKVKYLKNLN